MYGQISFLGEVLPQQPIGILVRSTLPGTLGITEVDSDVSCQREPLGSILVRSGGEVSNLAETEIEGLVLSRIESPSEQRFSALGMAEVSPQKEQLSSAALRG